MTADALVRSDIPLIVENLSKGTVDGAATGLSVRLALTYKLL